MPDLVVDRNQGELVQIGASSGCNGGCAGCGGCGATAAQKEAKVGPTKFSEKIAKQVGSKGYFDGAILDNKSANVQEAVKALLNGKPGEAVQNLSSTPQEVKFIEVASNSLGRNNTPTISINTPTYSTPLAGSIPMNYSVTNNVVPINNVAANNAVPFIRSGIQSTLSSSQSPSQRPPSTNVTNNVEIPRVTSEATKVRETLQRATETTKQAEKAVEKFVEAVQEKISEKTKVEKESAQERKVEIRKGAENKVKENKEASLDQKRSIGDVISSLVQVGKRFATTLQNPSQQNSMQRVGRQIEAKSVETKAVDGKSLGFKIATPTSTKPLSSESSKVSPTSVAKSEVAKGEVVVKPVNSSVILNKESSPVNSSRAPLSSTAEITTSLSKGANTNVASPVTLQRNITPSVGGANNITPLRAGGEQQSRVKTSTVASVKVTTSNNTDNNGRGLQPSKSNSVEKVTVNRVAPRSVKSSQATLTPTPTRSTPSLVALLRAINQTLNVTAQNAALQQQTALKRQRRLQKEIEALLAERFGSNNVDELIATFSEEDGVNSSIVKELKELKRGVTPTTTTESTSSEELTEVETESAGLGTPDSGVSTTLDTHQSADS